MQREEYADYMAARRKRMRRWLYSCAGMAGILGMGFTILYLAAPENPVEQVTIKSMDSDGSAHLPRQAGYTDGFIGVIIADEAVDVATRVDGIITKIHVRLGDRVSENGAIATIDVQALRNEQAVVQAGLSAASAERDRAELELTEAREQRERWHAINARDAGVVVVSREELAALVYKQQYAAQRLKAAEAEVAEYRARVYDLERRVSESIVRAPFDGVVAKRYVDTGAAVRSGDPIVHLVHEGAFWVRFAIPESASLIIRQGGLVTVRVETLDSELSATIEKVAPEIDAASQMIFVEALLSVPAQVAELPLSGRVARVYPADDR